MFIVDFTMCERRNELITEIINSLQTPNECYITPTDDDCTTQLNLKRFPYMSTTYIHLFNPTVDTEFVEIVQFILANDFDVTNP